MIVILVILSICLICLVGIFIYAFIYAIPNEMKGDGRTSKVVESLKKKAEPTIQISINLYSKQTSLDGTHYKYQVPISHASFYIPNLKDTLIYHDSNFIVREVKRDFNTNKVIITAYKV